MRYTSIIVWLLLFIIHPAAAQTYTAACPGAMPSRLVTGQQAIINASGGSNLRDRPSTLAQLLDIVPPGEYVDVVDGPFCGEGYAWWQIDARGLRGWAAEGGGDIYWLEPFVVQAAQIGSIRVEALPELAVGLQGERSEFYTAFALTGYPVEAAYHPPRLYIYMPPPVSSEVDLTNRAIQQREPALLDIPILAQTAFLELPQGSGIRFVSVFFDPAERARPAYVLYTFRGFTDDGAFISLNLAVNPPATVLDPAQPISNLRRFEQITVEALNSFTPESFTPPLPLLDALVQSLNTHAPLESSDLLRYAPESWISLYWHPLLAWEIRSQLVQESGTIPYVQLDFAGYPLAGDTRIRLYRTADLDSRQLVSLQMLLDRQRSSPAHIPAPAVPDTGYDDPEQVLYLDALTGRGVRFTSLQADGTLMYGYQGLSANRGWLISATFPLTESEGAFYPPLELLDAMIQSIELAAP